MGGLVEVKVGEDGRLVLFVKSPFTALTTLPTPQRLFYLDKADLFAVYYEIYNFLRRVAEGKEEKEVMENDGDGKG